MAEFTFTITAGQLSNGLRTSKRSPRDAGYLVESKGAVGRNGVLTAVDELTRIATTVITDAFPFPQLFVFTSLILVCSRTKIYEWSGGSLVLKYTATTAGSTWSAVDFYEYVYLSNGEEAVVRSAETGLYSLSATLPTGMSLCNFNGQVVIGSPDVIVDGASLSIPASVASITMTLLGSWS